MKKATYLLLVLAFFIAGTSFSEARQQIGVIWDIPENPDQAIQQLNLFNELGVQALELPHPVENDILNVLPDFDFDVFIRTENEFFTFSEIQHHSQLYQEFRALSQAYQSNFNVVGIGLFSNSQIYLSEFSTTFSPVLDSLYNQSNKEFYFHQSGNWYYFHRPDIPFAKETVDEEFNLEDLIVFNEQMSNSKSTPELHFLHSEWLFPGLEEYPELRNSLVSFKESDEWLLPLPEVQTQQIPVNLPVIILLLLWMSLAVLLRLNPMSRPTIIRYLLSHRFYADDIVHYRERSASTALTLLAQHVVFSGLAFYILANILFTANGIEAFFHHLPALAVTGHNYISFFFLGMIFSLIIPLISLLWLHFSSKTIRHFSQTLNLYSGIFFLDFIIVTVMLTLYLAGIGNTFILVLGALFLICSIEAFYLAAGDISKSLMVGKFTYLTITMGIHTSILILLTILLLNSTYLLQVIDMAVSL